MVGVDTFRFLNREERVSTAGDWNSAQRELLWSYNLHYFDDLCAAGAAKRVDWHRALITRWIADNPIGRGCGWDPYPTSRRVVNWIKWELAGGAVNPRRMGGQDIAGHSLSVPAIQSLAVQARYLAPRVEWHLLGNHLIANAKALVFAGCFSMARKRRGGCETA